MGRPRIIQSHERAHAAEEDPGRGRLAVCERAASHRPRSGVRRAVGHVRPLSPAEGQRRPDGERHRRARHAGDGGRGRRGLEPQEYGDRIVGVWRRCRGGSGSRTTSSFARPMRATSASFRTSCSGSTTTATSTRASTPASTRRLRGLQAEAELVDGKCPRARHACPSDIEEKNDFFRLSAYQERLLELYDERRDFVLPDYRVQRGAAASSSAVSQDFSISRAGQPWGVPIPWDHGAGRLRLGRRPVNYLSASDLRARRGSRGAFLAGRSASAREGHPRLPLRDLARAAPRRPDTRCRSSCSSTASSSSTSGRSRSRSAT